MAPLSAALPALGATDGQAQSGKGVRSHEHIWVLWGTEAPGPVQGEGGAGWAGPWERCWAAEGVGGHKALPVLGAAIQAQPL